MKFEYLYNLENISKINDVYIYRLYCMQSYEQK